MVRSRSYNRGRRPQERGPRGSIEIAHVLFLEPTAPPSTSQLAQEPANLRGSRVEFQEMGDRLATLLECPLNFPSALNLDIQCMHSGRISQCYINITRNKFIAKTSQAYTTKKKKTVKLRVGSGQTWNICTEGRLLDHCATLPRISLSGKIIYLIYFPVKFCRLTLFEAGEAVLIVLPPLFL